MRRCNSVCHPDKYSRDLSDDLFPKSRGSVCSMCKALQEDVRMQDPEYFVKRQFAILRSDYAKHSCPRRELMGIKWELTFAQFREIAFRPCYVGGSRTGEIGRDSRPVRVAVDRINADQSESVDNVLPCCSFHNQVRGLEISVEEMLTLVTVCPRLRQCGWSHQSIAQSERHERNTREKFLPYLLGA